MERKKEKSPVLVGVIIVFLSLFIVLPPLFRGIFTKEVDEVVEPSVEKAINYTLICEKVLPSENKKIVHEVIYKENVAITDTITYTDYNSDTVLNDAGTEKNSIKTVAEEVASFKLIPGIQVTEEQGKVVVVIPKMVITNNPENLDLSNYLLEISKQTSHFEKQGYVCTKKDN